MSIFDICMGFIICIIEIFLIYDFFNNFFELKIDKKYVKYNFIFVCIIHFGINLLRNSWLNLVFTPIIVWVFVSILFESSIGVRFQYFIIACIVNIGVEFMYFILISQVGVLSETGIASVTVYGWQGIFVKFLNFIIFLLLKQTSHKSHSHMENKLFYIYLCLPVSSFGIMIVTFYSGIDFQKNTILKSFMTIFFILMFFGNILLFYAFQKHTEDLNEKAKQQLELYYKNAEIEKLSKIVEMNDDYNETVHNMAHSLKAIEQIAVEKGVEEIRDIIDDLTGRLMPKKIYEYSSNKMLNTILSEYKMQAQKNGIEFKIYVEPGSNIENISDIDLISMLGNMLDNAFEAVFGMSDPLIEVRIFMAEKGNVCFIRIVNDYINEFEVRNEKVLSTKKDSGVHGIGLSSILKTAEKYNGNFSFYTVDKKFYAVLMLPVNM